MSFVCTVCGQTHDSLPTWGYRRPDAWLRLTEAEQSRGQCNDDLCRTPDQQCFVRAVIELQLIGGPEPTFEIGAWVQLAPAAFDRYVDTFKDSNQSRIGRLPAVLSNEVRAFPGSLWLRGILAPQDNLQRPFLLLDPTDHPLGVAQREGVSFAKVLEIIHPDEVRH